MSQLHTAILSAICINLMLSCILAEQNKNHRTYTNINPKEMLAEFSRKACNVSSTKPVSVHIRPFYCVLYLKKETFSSGTTVLSTGKSTTPLNPSTETSTVAPTTTVTGIPNIKPQCDGKLELNCDLLANECTNIFYCPGKITPVEDEYPCTCNQGMLTCDCMVRSFQLVYENGTEVNINVMTVVPNGNQLNVIECDFMIFDGPDFASLSMVPNFKINC